MRVYLPRDAAARALGADALAKALQDAAAARGSSSFLFSHLVQLCSDSPIIKDFTLIT